MQYKNIRTYIQSGNVMFDTMETDPTELEVKIETALLDSLGYLVSVIVRTKIELLKVIQSPPFDRFPNAGEKKYLTMLKHDAVIQEPLPLFSELKDVEIIEVKGKNLFCYSLPSIKGDMDFQMYS